MFHDEDVEIYFGDVPILGKNYSIDFSEEAAKRVLQQKEIKITVNLDQGSSSASFWAVGPVSTTCAVPDRHVPRWALYESPMIGATDPVPVPVPGEYSVVSVVPVYTLW